MDNIIFEVTDKTGRKIRLTNRQWNHITSPSSLHAYMANQLEKIKETLTNPDKIIRSINNDSKASYYRYYKEIDRYANVVVKYLNRSGFVITAYFTKNLKI